MPAHVTLRGPFRSAQAAHQNVADLFEHEIAILGVGRFPSPQSTIFLVCGSPAIKERWWKPDYGFNPHVTLYDGQTKSTADDLHTLLKRKRLYGRTMLSPVTAYESTSGQRNAALSLSIDFAALSELAGHNLNLEAVKGLSSRERLIFIDRLSDRLRHLLDVEQKRD